MIPCEGCRCRASEHTHHIVSRGACGDNDPKNLMRLCSVCHGLYHDHGWRAFIDLYPYTKKRVLAARERLGKNCDLRGRDKE